MNIHATLTGMGSLLARGCLVLLVLTAGLGAQRPVPQQTQPAFDVTAATNAYLARLSPEKKARSDAYFEGGYWLQLWDFLWGAAVSLLLLYGRISSRMRDAARRITRFSPLQTLVYWVQFVLVTAALSFPLTVYEGFFREHQYGLATQNFAGWFGDFLKGLAVSAVLGGLLVMALFGIVRRLPSTWHVWGAAAATLFVILGGLIAPVFIAPLFNKYTRLNDPKVVAPILSMARANGIPAQDVYQVDASRQSTRVSANVSGFLGTERITLNDNLLRRCTLPEIEAVMGHEMGHYVLNHAYKFIAWAIILGLAAFAFLRRASGWALGRWGTRWGIQGIGDVAVTPLAVLLISIVFFVLTPLLNTLVRTQEYEADIFGLNAARQPDGFAEVALKLSDYRKLDPGPLEEWIFFDHPSGRTRITAAMRWKAENLR